MIDRRSSNRATIHRVIKEDPPSDRLVSPVLRDLGSANMGDPQTLKDFIIWTSTNYPALNYALILWDHGGSFAGVCWDHGVNPNERLTMTELETALSGAGMHLGVVMFMACLMSSIEVAYQIRKCCDYVVASEAVSGPYIWHFNSIFAHVCNNPSISARDLASFMLVFHGMNIEWQFGTLAQLDLSQLDNLATAVDGLGKLLKDNLRSYGPQIERARSRVENTLTYQNGTQHLVDLYRFAEEIFYDTTITSESIRAAAWNVMVAVSNAVIKSRVGPYS